MSTQAANNRPELCAILAPKTDGANMWEPFHNTSLFSEGPKLTWRPVIHGPRLPSQLSLVRRSSLTYYLKLGNWSNLKRATRHRVRGP